MTIECPVCQGQEFLAHVEERPLWNIMADEDIFKGKLKPVEGNVDRYFNYKCTSCEHQAVVKNDKWQCVLYEDADDYESDLDSFIHIEGIKEFDSKEKAIEFIKGRDNWHLVEPKGGVNE